MSFHHRAAVVNHTAVHQPFKVFVQWHFIRLRRPFDEVFDQELMRRVTAGDDDAIQRNGIARQKLALLTQA